MKGKLAEPLAPFSLFITEQKAYDFEWYLKSGSGMPSEYAIRIKL